MKFNALLLATSFALVNANTNTLPAVSGESKVSVFGAIKNSAKDLATKVANSKAVTYVKDSKFGKFVANHKVLSAVVATAAVSAAVVYYVNKSANKKQVVKIEIEDDNNN